MNKTNTNTEFDPALFAQFQMFLAMQEQMNKDKDAAKSAKTFRPQRREKGTGGVTRLSGKRRRPFMASITSEPDPLYGNKKQIPLAYFYEKKQALKFLDLFNMEREGLVEANTTYNYVLSVNGSIPKSKSNPMSLYENTPYIATQNGLKSISASINPLACPTVSDIWSKVWLSDIEQLSASSKKSYTLAFKNLNIIADKPINQIKLNQIQPIFDNLMEKGYSSTLMNNVKIVLNYIFKYAEKYDYIDKNYAQYIKFKDGRTDEEKEDTKKIPYSKETIKQLFENDDNDVVQAILIMIYTGMRPSEFLQLKLENIHLEDRYMIGGLKTSNGINRIIPIHECIVPYIENLNKNSLLGKSYENLFIRYKKIRKQFKFECTLHSGRHTFASLANEYGLNEFLVKKIMGHSAKDLTKDVYTHIDYERLVNEVNKIPAVK